MKYANVLFAPAAAFALCQIASASTGPTFYGTIYAEARASDVKTTTTYSDGSRTVEKSGRPELYDNGSRMGFRGSEKLNDTLEVLYRVEWRAPFESEHRNFEPRDSWLAVKHQKYGTLKAGRLLSPEAYIRYTYDYPTWGADGNRSNNAIRYESPTIKDTYVWLHYVMDENKETDSLDTDGYGVLVHHKKENYGLGAAYFSTDSHKKLHGVQFKNQFRATGFYKPNKKTQLDFIYQQNDFNDIHYGQASKDNWGIGVGGNYAINDKDTFYLHFNYAENPFGKDGSFKSTSIAAERQFTPNFAAFTELFLSKETINAPAYNGALAHKEQTEDVTLILGTSYRF